MLLRFVAGRAGSGKSTWVYDAVRRDLAQGGRPVYIVVPEQYTLQTEKELIEALGVRGLIEARVTSPSRLAEEVFSQVGQDRRAVISASGLAMALRAAANGVAEELKAFKSVLGFSGFSAGMVRLISELKQFDVSPEDMLAASERARGALKAKAQDIATIYREYDRYLSSRSYMDADDRFNGFVSGIGKAESLKECNFYFDGFDHLSPQSCRMIGELLPIARSVTLTQDYDGFGSSDADLFRAAHENITRLTEIAREIGAEIEWAHILTGEREQAMPPDVAQLERSLFNWDAKPANALGGVTLCRAADPEQEAEAAAAWIVEKVREGNLRWREVSMQCGDLAVYSPIVARVFRQYGIPCFIDSRKAIAGHPAVRFMLSLVKVLQRGYRVDDALRLVKTGYAGVSPEEADALEVYLTAFAPRGAKAWASDWEKGRGEYDLAALNKSRKAVYDLTQPLARNTSAHQATGSQWARALYALLEERKLDEALDEHTARLKRAGLLEEAAVTQRIWNAVVDTLDQLDEIIGEEPLDAAAFGQILQSGLESIEEGILPTGVDQVQVGSVGRSKTSGLKYMLLIGAADGSLSEPLQSGGILTERDVDALAPLGVEAGRGGALRASQKRFAIYEAVTKGAEGLYISWPMDSEEAKPDRVVERAMALLGLSDRDVLEAGRIIARPSCAGGVCGRLPELVRKLAGGSKPDENEAAQLKWLLERREYTGKSNDLMPDTAVAGPEYLRAAGTVFSAIPALSASELETYGDCPFKHFVEFALRPSDWREYGIRNADAGSFLHAAMERLGRRLALLKHDVESIGEAGTQALIAKEAEGLRREFGFGVLESSARLRWSGGNLGRICSVAAATFARQLACGSFVPCGEEIRFGRGGMPLPALSLPDGSTAFLQGRMDRVDVFHAQDADWLRVIDYKSGKAGIDVVSAVNGLDVQTWLYLYAMRELWTRASSRPGRAAGAYIFPLANPWVEEGADEEKLRRDELRLRGWCLGDAEVMRAMDATAVGNKSNLYNFSSRSGGLLDESVAASALGIVAKNAGAAAEKMRRGHVAAHPWRSGRETACQACGYDALCRFSLREQKTYRRLLDSTAVKTMLGISEGAEDSALDG